MERGAHKSSHQSSWSWDLRKKRSLEQAAEDPQQLRITDYWNLMDSVEQLQYKNEKLSMLLRVRAFFSCSSSESNQIKIQQSLAQYDKQCGTELW